MLFKIQMLLLPQRTIQVSPEAGVRDVYRTNAPFIAPFCEFFASRPFLYQSGCQFAELYPLCRVKSEANVVPITFNYKFSSERSQLRSSNWQNPGMMKANNLGEQP
jgi:hypothetical protein